MRKLIFVLACLNCCVGYGQINLDSVLQKKMDDCLNIRNNAMYFLAKYIKEDRADSARQVYAIWKTNCLPDKEMIYTGAILDLMQKRKIDVADSIEFTNALLDNDFDNRYYVGNGYYYSSYNQYKTYDYTLASAINDKAEKILPTLKEGSFEEMVCLMLAGYRSDALHILKSKKMTNSAMQNQFLKRRKNLITKNGAHMQMRSGAWLPMGAASKLGVNTIMGFTIGGTYGKCNIIELAIEGRIGATPTDTVEVKYRDSLYTTDFISGLYVGLEFDKNLWRSPNLRHRFGWRTGWGYDHINVLPESLRNVEDANPDDGTTTTPRKYLPSIGANTGVTYNFRLSNVCHLGVYGKYNYHLYRNTNGTNVNGPSFSAIFLISFYFINEQEMKRLGYSF